MTRLFYLAFGRIAVALGVLGVVLPLLPTTPFLILAAFAFGKSSPRLRQWLIDHATFGPPIRRWEEDGAIARPVKILACSMMAGVLLMSVVMGLKPMLIAIQAICMGGAALFILTRPD